MPDKQTDTHVNLLYRLHSNLFWTVQLNLGPSTPEIFLNKYIGLLHKGLSRRPQYSIKEGPWNLIKIRSQIHVAQKNKKVFKF